MTIVMGTPSPERFRSVVGSLREWQHDGAPFQLHPGDLGWYCRFGLDAAAAAVRTWSRDGQVLAVGLLDGPGLLRLTTAPDVRDDEELAGSVVEDVIDPGRGVLPAGRAAVEIPTGSVVRDALRANGWRDDEPWTPLRRELADAVPEPGVGVEVVGPDRAADWTDVLRSAFDSPTSTSEPWHAMTSATADDEVRSVVAYDEAGDAVAAVTVWSAGPDRPGLIEPMGVHRDQRRHGYGTAICVAAAAALRALGASSAIVATQSSNLGAVATYVAAGYRPLPERLDCVRDG